MQCVRGICHVVGVPVGYVWSVWVGKCGSGVLAHASLCECVDRIHLGGCLRCVYRMWKSPVCVWGGEDSVFLGYMHIG